MPMIKVTYSTAVVFVLGLVVCAPRSASAQCQRTVLTEREFGGLGVDPSVSGDYLVSCGDSFMNEIGGVFGAAHVFKRDHQGTWTEQARLTDDDPQNDFFGWTCGISGDFVVVGAFFHRVGCDDPTCETGAAYVFQRDASDWYQVAKLIASDFAPDDRFARSVSISGDYIAIGSHRDDNAAGRNAGSVYVFRRQGSDWVEEAKFTASDATGGLKFGSKVAITDDRIVVGAWAGNADPDQDPCQAGAAYVFRREGTDWVEEAKLTASDWACADFFGDAVAINGDFIAVGATGDDHPGDVTGSAYVFQRFGTSWVEQTKLTPTHGDARDVFGFSVGVAGDALVVGSLNWDFPTGIGKAYIYRRQGSSWIQLDHVMADGRAWATSGFGAFVTTDGREVFVGGAGVEVGDGDKSGSVYVYPIPEDCNENGVVDSCEVTGGTSQDCNDNFVPDECDPDCNGNGRPDDCDIVDGVSRDCNGNGVPDDCDVDGDPQLDLNGDGIPDECSAPPPPAQCATQKLDSVSASQDRFGWSVAIDGEYAAVGALRDDATGSDTGSVFVYRRQSTDWVLEAQLTPDDPEVKQFGTTVGLSNDRVVVGVSSGEVAYVYRRDGETWIQEAELTSPDGGGTEQRFGAYVAIHGNQVVVGAQWVNLPHTHSGSVYVFRREGLDWVFERKLVASDSHAADQFGQGVAIRDDLIAVGSSDRAAGPLIGAVYLYRRVGTNWIEEAKLVASDREPFDEFGWRMAIGDGVVVVGNGGNDDVCPEEMWCDSGSAHVYRRGDDGWFEEAKLVASDAQEGDRFGIAVGISGDTIAVGSPEDAVDGSGEAYIFKYDGVGWNQEAKIRASDAGLDEMFGMIIGSGENCIIVGAPLKGGEAGAAYVFENDNGEWKEQAALSNLEKPVALARFGVVVAMSGDLAVVGAPSDNNPVNGEPEGSAYVYRREGSTWILEEQFFGGGAALGYGVALAISGDDLIVAAPLAGGHAILIFKRAADGTWPEEYWRDIANDLSGLGKLDGMEVFGRSVAIKGDYVFAGDLHADDTGLDSGRVHVFHREGDDWPYHSQLSGSDVLANDSFGRSLSADGDLLLVGAHRDDEAAADAGTVYVFRRIGSNWTEEAKLIATDAVGGDQFGTAVALSSDVAVIGAPLADASGIDSGAAYIFWRNGGDWIEEAKLLAPDGLLGDRFGTSVAIDGDLIIVGAEYEGVGGTKSDTGAAYVYRREGVEWVFKSKLTGTDGTWGPRFGSSVAISGNSAIIGSTFADTWQVSETGAAYAYTLDFDEPDCDGNGTPDSCEPDCNVNGIPDPCDLFPLGTSEDCNFDSIPDECQLVGNDCNANAIPDDCEPDDNGNGVPDGCCAATSECIDADRCTFDLCSANICTNTPATYGDVSGIGFTCGPNGTVDLSDILAVLDGFQNVFAPGCEVSNVDIASQSDGCAPDGVIDLTDILAVLDAFQGNTTCCPGE